MSVVIPERKKRDRVARACLYCRKKKVKCDGQSPCGNCKSYLGGECTYPSETKKRVRNKRAKNDKGQSISELDSRLAKLEGLLTNLASKLGAGNLELTESDEQSENDGVDEDETGEGGDESITKENEGSNPPIQAKDLDIEGDYSRDTREKNGSLLFVLKHEEQCNTNTERTYCLPEAFYGSHSMFHIFSEKSLEWMHSRLPREHIHLLIPVRNLPRLFSICIESFNEVWSGANSKDGRSKQKMAEGDFPEAQELVYDLLEAFSRVFMAGQLVETSYLRKLFENYYNNQKYEGGRTYNRGVRYQFRSSELLIMNISLALCISHVLYKRKPGPCTPTSGEQISLCNTPTLDAYGEDDLIKLQSQFLVSSIHYYQKVSVMSEGVSTVQAILLFIIYLELTLVKSTANYILAAVAVRFAQEIGLHRCESFEGLPIEEVAFRRKLWWFCEYLDIEICYRHGKPPLINPADVSTLTRKDFISGSTVKNLPFNINTDNHLDPKLLKFLLEEKGLDVYFGHFMSLLNRLRFEAYSKLFSASSCDHSFTDIIYILTSMNKKMWELGSSMSPELRPRFYNDSEFGNSALFQNKTIEDGQLVMLLSFHLAFFTQLMTMNRLITRLKCDPHEIEIKNSEAIYLRDLASDSARTIVHITLRTVRNTISASNLSWLIFYSSAAVLDILQSCLNKPKSEDTVSDMELLIDGMINCSVKQLFRNPPKNGEMFNQIDSVMCLVTFIMLQMGIRIVESQSKRVFFDNNPYLIQISNHFMALFPELYQKKRADPILRAEIVNPATQSDRSSTASDLIGDSKSNFTATTAPSTDSTGNSMNSFGEVSPMGCPGLIPGPTGYLSVHDPKNPLINSVWDSKVSPNYGNSPSPSTYFSGKIPLGDPEFNEALDRVFGGGTPNFFYDNSIGL
ncbi:Fungal Zn2Cys6 Cluster domain [Yamadazyma tenuis]|uniref:Fungal Zn2Cys6 Cluster domain n=1 Tax=Candida tenuis TaxID=2315449 RepID=UPI0027A7A3A6|nr:Fungal Zn2Cys6 Cluster domain [Yamadazyma tenuis]